MVQNLLAMGGDGLCPMALAPPGPVSVAAQGHLKSLTAATSLPGAFSPKGALCGLFLYFSCLDDAHKIAQDLHTPEGSFWHGIMHRQEPDPENAAYWFRQLGKHPVFPALATAAQKLGYAAGAHWDPFAFINYCESARRRPGSTEEALALRVQLAEWQLLFDHCARSGKSRTQP